MRSIFFSTVALLALLTTQNVAVSQDAVSPGNEPPPIACPDDAATMEEILAAVDAAEALGEVTDILFIDNKEDLDATLLYIASNGGNIEGLLGVADAGVYYFPTSEDTLILEGFVDGCHIGYVSWTYDELGIVVTE